MTDPLVLWSTIVGFVLPPILAIIMQSRWRPEVKGLVVFLACLIAATGTVAFQGQIGNSTALTTSILLIFAGAITSYRLYWRPTGIAPLIERSAGTQTTRAGNHLARWRPFPRHRIAPKRCANGCPGEDPEIRRK